MSEQVYDASVARNLARGAAEQMGEKRALADMASRAQGQGASPVNPDDFIDGVEVKFLANGFLVGPSFTMLGRDRNRIAHVARDKDELLKIIGQMVDAHGPKAG